MTRFACERRSAYLDGVGGTEGVEVEGSVLSVDGELLPDVPVREHVVAGEVLGPRREAFVEPEGRGRVGMGSVRLRGVAHRLKQLLS